jgi:hypothetical protein
MVMRKRSLLRPWRRLEYGIKKCGSEEYYMGVRTGLNWLRIGSVSGTS